MKNVILLFFTLQLVLTIGCTNPTGGDSGSTGGSGGESTSLSDYTIESLPAAKGSDPFAGNVFYEGNDYKYVFENGLLKKYKEENSGYTRDGIFGYSYDSDKQFLYLQARPSEVELKQDLDLLNSKSWENVVRGCGIGPARWNYNTPDLTETLAKTEVCKALEEIWGYTAAAAAEFTPYQFVRQWLKLRYKIGPDADMSTADLMKTIVYDSCLVEQFRYTISTESDQKFLSVTGFYDTTKSWYEQRNGNFEDQQGLGLAYTRSDANCSCMRVTGESHLGLLMLDSQKKVLSGTIVNEIFGSDGSVQAYKSFPVSSPVSVSGSGEDTVVHVTVNSISYDLTWDDDNHI